MSSQNRSQRDDRATLEPRTAPEAEASEGHSPQQRGARWSIISAVIALVVIVIAGFVITIVAGRVPEDRPRDVPPATVTSSIMGPAGDNTNNNG